MWHIGWSYPKKWLLSIAELRWRSPGLRNWPLGQAQNLRALATRSSATLRRANFFPVRHWRRSSFQGFRTERFEDPTWKIKKGLVRPSRVKVVKIRNNDSRVRIASDRDTKVARKWKKDHGAVKFWWKRHINPVSQTWIEEYVKSAERKHFHRRRGQIRGAGQGALGKKTLIATEKNANKPWWNYRKSQIWARWVNIKRIKIKKRLTRKTEKIEWRKYEKRG